MVKKIMRDPFFLAQKSEDATEADRQVVTDLLDTLRANLDRCVGMAANMIGVRKNSIVVAARLFQFAMINPVITKKSGAYQTEEGCLSLDGVRSCTRYEEIEVDYLDQNLRAAVAKCRACSGIWRLLRSTSIYASSRSNTGNIPAGRHRSFSMR